MDFIIHCELIVTPNYLLYLNVQVLLSKISDESCKSKESCWAVNFILYFLFRELKNSEGVRRWVLRKLALEFDELLASSVLGKFFSSITVSPQPFKLKVLFIFTSFCIN